MAHPRYWLKAFRLRTLPLALSTVWMGSIAAAIDGFYSQSIFILATITTLFLQILSNLANDYGDAVSGADDQRVGPLRMVQSGLITRRQMLMMMFVFVILAFCSGILLLFAAFPHFLSGVGLLFLLIGILAIGAAINYTVGKNPYGYKGWGDFFVFIFFGLVGVAGTYFLHAQQYNWWILLPASAIGFMSVGVLNVNNMRDRETDAVSGKRSLVVMYGATFGRLFQLILVSLSFILLVVYVNWATEGRFLWLFLVTAPVYVLHLIKIFKAKSHELVDPELKRLSLTIFFTVLLLALGYYLNAL